MGPHPNKIKLLLKQHSLASTSQNPELKLQNSCLEERTSVDAVNNGYFNDMFWDFRCDKLEFKN